MEARAKMKEMVAVAVMAAMLVMVALGGRAGRKARIWTRKNLIEVIAHRPENENEDANSDVSQSASLSSDGEATRTVQAFWEPILQEEAERQQSGAESDKFRAIPRI